MKNTIKWIANRLPKTGAEKELALMDIKRIEQVRAFHRSFPRYHPTPLISLNNLARSNGLGGVHIKDESYRFGLNAFKVLGGSYAMARFIAEKTGRNASELRYDVLTNPAFAKNPGDFTFFAATDGNHGRGVAWAAHQIGQKSVIYMPKGSSQIRLENIRKEGASAKITDLNYDDTVRLAYAESLKTPNSVIIQDTAWAGYEEIPGWIMQGYGTMTLEAIEQLRERSVDRPTHIFVQAGVGSLAGAVQGFFKNLFPEAPPVTVIVEAAAADCIYRSAVKGDGGTMDIGGELATIMAGLACGEANPISWEILKEAGAFFVSLPDTAAALGMRVLASPLPGDRQIISGESGAAGMGLLMALLQKPSSLRDALGLDEHSHVLLFSTEGDTDPEAYRQIVWNGAYSWNPNTVIQEEHET